MVWGAIIVFERREKTNYGIILKELCHWVRCVLCFVYCVCGVMWCDVVLNSNKPNTLIIKRHKLRTIAIFAGRQFKWTRTNIVNSVAAPYFEWFPPVIPSISNDWKSTSPHTTPTYKHGMHSTQTKRTHTCERTLKKHSEKFWLSMDLPTAWLVQPNRYIRSFVTRSYFLIILTSKIAN